MKAGLLLLLLVGFSSLQTHAQNVQWSIEKAIGLQVGDTVTDFQAMDQEDSTFNLNAALQNGPIVLVFYRGQWCPFCNRHLSDLQDSLSLITEKGGQVIAISPEKPEYLTKMREKTGASFTLLYDQGYKIAEQFGVLFAPDSATIRKYNTFLNANLQEAHGNDQELLPIPATYIIARDGTIVWRHFDPNYKNRSSVMEILKNLPEY